MTGIVRYLIYLLLIFTPLARGSVQLWAISAVNMITFTALTVYLIQRAVTQDWKWIRTPLDLPILVLLILCLLSSVFSLHRQSSLQALVLLLNYTIIFYLVTDITKSRSGLRSLVYIIISIALFLSVFGLFKRFGVNPFPWWDYSDLKYSPEFLSATYGNHNHLAGYLEMTIPLLLGLFITGFRGEKIFLLIYFTFLLALALILSLSRGGWLASILSLSFMATVLFRNRYFKKKGFLGMVVGSLFVLCVIILASTPVVERIQTFAGREEEASFASRLPVWGGTIKMIGDHPVLGTGPGTFKTVFTQYQPPGIARQFQMAHNDYLHFISETGLLLIPIIVWLTFVLYKRGFEKMKNPSRLVRGTTLGAMTGITAILIHSFADFNLHIPANAILFTVLAAIVAAPSPSKK